MTTSEIIADLERKVAFWESEAIGKPEGIANACLDYARHTRVLAELLRLGELDQTA